MDPLALIGVIAAVVVAIAALYAMFFEKPLVSALKVWFSRRRMPKPKPRGPNVPEKPKAGEGGSNVSEILRPSQMLQKKADEIEELVKASAYKEAESLGDECLRDYPGWESPGSGELSEYVLTRALLIVRFSHALIYTGRAVEAVEKLRDVIRQVTSERELDTLPDGPFRKSLVLGLAHRHIGYSYWMELGQYKAAVEETRASIPCFLANKGDVRIKKELATAYDNLGRIYAELGYRDRAEWLVGLGGRLRHEMGDRYRYALSLNSSAIVSLSFGQAGRALDASQQALEIFNSDNEYGRRGAGLAYITIGQARRYLASYARKTISESRSGSEGADIAEQHIEKAKDSLMKAKEIFAETAGDDGHVFEPIRRVQTLDELGCAHRERAAMRMPDDTNSVKDADTCFNDSLRLLVVEQDARSSGRRCLRSDILEDSARLFTITGQVSKARKALEGAEQEIELQKQAPVDDALRQKAKIHALRAHLEFIDIRKKLEKSEQLDAGLEKRIDGAIHEYAHSLCCLARFAALGVESGGGKQEFDFSSASLSILENQRLLHGQLFGDLQVLPAAQLIRIREGVLPQFIRELTGQNVWFAGLFDALEECQLIAA